MTSNGWKPDRLIEFLLHEQGKLVHYKRLSLVEGETIGALLNEIVFTLLDLEDPPIGSNRSIDPKFLQALRDTLEDRRQYRKASGIRGAAQPFSQITCIEAHRAARQDDVVPISRNIVRVPSEKN